MNSRLYKAKVHHRRLRPKQHGFSYSLTYCAFDLDELPELDRENWFFGYNKRSLLSLHDRDYLTPEEGSLKSKLLQRLEGKPYREEVDRVFLVTCARWLHYAFNPVSFFYCYSRDSGLLAVLVEVNNTFGERHTYLLDEGCQLDNPSLYRAFKTFHVSPFNDMDGHYEFQLSDPRERLDISIDLVTQGAIKMETSLQGQPETLTANNLMKAKLKDPISNFLTLPRIHLEALVLYFRKKLQFFSAPPPSSPDTYQVKSASLIQSFAESLVVRAFAQVQRGAVVLRLPDGRVRRFGEAEGPAQFLHIHSYEFFTRLLRSGDIGFGEAYVEGLFDCDDLTGLLQLMLENRRATINEVQPLVSALGRFFHTVFHGMRKNTLRGSRQNISAHYDLSNELFESFLDPTMTYSSGLFSTEDDSLEVSQLQKLDALLDLADIEPGDHLLELGCGWGSLAIRAAKTRGCRVTGITLSQEQLDYARRRVEEEGLREQIEFRLCDFRELEGCFDKIVSIEMLEAVGHENQEVFVKACRRLLKPGGKAAIQVITMADEHYDLYRRECDWIQRYIFPGGCLVSMRHFGELSGKNVMLLDSCRYFGVDYARTLRLWRERFQDVKERVLDMGFDDRFLRMWDYYLCYCEAGFLSGPIDVVQFRLTK